jgi:phosphatidylinositol alpha-1,6-mannosyltransferase
MGNRKLLFVSTEFPPGPGGIGSHAFQLIKELRKIGWEVEVLSEQDYATESEIEDYNKSAGFKISRLRPTPSMFKFIAKLLFVVWRILSFKPAVVIGTGKHACWFAVLAAKITFTKSVCIGHGTEFTKVMTDKAVKFNKWVFNNCNAIIAVSNFTKRKIEEAGIKTSMVVIQNGANQEFFKRLSAHEVEVFKKSKGIESQKILITVGNVTQRKGQQMVIKALPGVLAVEPLTHYYCIGLPTLADKFTALAKELGVEENIHFLGKQKAEDLLNWLNAADVFVMTSVTTEQGSFEGFGIAVIEAAMCGKPAIVYSNSGLAEAVEDEKTGLVVEEGNIEETKEAVLKLLKDEILCDKLGAVAYERAWKEYTWKQKAETYNRFFLNL